VPVHTARALTRKGNVFDKVGSDWQAAPHRGHTMIDFKNLIVGSHESKVLFTWNHDNGVAMLGAYLGIEDGIEAILARDETTPAQRTILEEFRAIAGENNWDFAALRESLS
jgi:hypothetical protein